MKLFGHQVKTNYSGRFRPGSFNTLSRNESTGKYNTVELPGNREKFNFIEQYLRQHQTKALEDVTKFEIRIIDKKIQRTIESPLYTPTQLISEIGGQLGVWIGVSVITLVEVIELLVDLCRECLQSKRKKELGTSEENAIQDGGNIERCDGRRGQEGAPQQMNGDMYGES